MRFASATSSAIFLTGWEGCTTIVTGAIATRAIGVKSRTASVLVFDQSGNLIRHWGGFPGGTHPVRYLYSPVTNDFVSLLNYNNDDFIPPSEVEKWERRLGFTVPPTQLS
jgi:hypothetical protein